MSHFHQQKVHMYMYVTENIDTFGFYKTWLRCKSILIWKGNYCTANLGWFISDKTKLIIIGIGILTLTQIGPSKIMYFTENVCFQSHYFNKYLCQI